MRIETISGGGDTNKIILNGVDIAPVVTCAVVVFDGSGPPNVYAATDRKSISVWFRAMADHYDRLTAQAGGAR